MRDCSGTMVSQLTPGSIKLSSDNENDDGQPISPRFAEIEIVATNDSFLLFDDILLNLADRNNNTYDEDVSYKETSMGSFLKASALIYNFKAFPCRAAKQASTSRMYSGSLKSRSL